MFFYRRGGAAPGSLLQQQNSRRESLTGPPSTDVRGSIHNLQLDIMDDIVQARKARMKLWNTSNEKVCEVHTLDENEAKGSPMRYTNRRYSDFVGASPLSTIQSHRRASEMPSLVSPSVSKSTTSSMASFGRKLKAGIVCTNTDLLGLLSTLTSSATEINEYEEIPTPTTTLITEDTLRVPSASSTAPRSPVPGRSPSVGAIPKVVTTREASPEPPQQPRRQTQRRKSHSRTSRSNSFDGSVLNNAKQLLTAADEKTAVLSGWFTKRHQPMAKKKAQSSTSSVLGFSKDALIDKFKDGRDKVDPRRKSMSARGGGGGSGGGGEGRDSGSGAGKLKWDTKSPVVDAHVIGNAIEGFLRRSSTASSKSGATATAKETSRLRKSEKGAGSSNGAGSSSRSVWFGKGDEDDSKDTCDSSLCSTLKDLFVK